MDNKIIIKDKENNEKEYDILFSFNSDRTNKKYIVYTDYSKDKENNITCYSAIYDNEQVLPVDTEEELKVIDDMLNTLSFTAQIKYKMLNN